MESTVTPGYPGAVYDGRPQSPTVSVGDWIVTYLISFIPFVGIIMLFVWAFSSSTPPSKANWAKAALVVSLVLLVLSFVFGGAIMAYLSTLSSHTTSTLN